MSDATPEEDKARELERMYDFFHTPDVTTDDVVARAVKELNGSLEVVNNLLEIETYKYEADSYQAKWQWHLKQLILTHLAEFGGHKRVVDNYPGLSIFCTCGLSLGKNSEGNLTNSDTCQIVELKAKRLMGEE